MNTKSLPSMVRNNFHLFVNKHVVLSDLPFCHVIILAGIILYIIILFLSLISVCHLSITYSNIKKNINKRKLNREKIDCQSYFRVMQGSVICTQMYVPMVTELKSQN